MNVGLLLCLDGRLSVQQYAYLLEIMVGYAEKAEGAVEAKREQGRAYPFSEQRSTAQAAPVAEFANLCKSEKTPMPEAVSRQLANFGIHRKTKEASDASD